MKNSKWIFFLLCSFCCYGYEQDVQEFTQQVALQLISKKDPSVLGLSTVYEVYLNPSQIVPSEKGLLLQTSENQLFSLPFLISSSKGCYLLLKEKNLQPLNGFKYKTSDPSVLPLTELEKEISFEKKEEN